MTGPAVVVSSVKAATTKPLSRPTGVGMTTMIRYLLAGRVTHLAPFAGRSRGPVPGTGKEGDGSHEQRAQSEVLHRRRLGRSRGAAHARCHQSRDRARGGHDQPG